MMMGSCFGSGAMMLLGLLLTLAVILLVALGIWALSASLRRPSLPGSGPQARDRVPVGGRSRAREILDERYARGELTIEEYWERQYALQN